MGLDQLVPGLSVVGVPGGGTVTGITFDSPLTAGGVAGGTIHTSGHAGIQINDATHAGYVPASGGGTVKFWRADGTWADPAGTGSDAVSLQLTTPGTPDTGNFNVSGTGVLDTALVATRVVTGPKNNVFNGTHGVFISTTGFSPGDSVFEMTGPDDVDRVNLFADGSWFLSATTTGAAFEMDTATADQSILGNNAKINGQAVKGQADGAGGIGIFGSSNLGASAFFQTSNVGGTNANPTVLIQAAADTNQVNTGLMEFRDPAGAPLGGFFYNASLAIGLAPTGDYTLHLVQSPNNTGVALFDINGNSGDHFLILQDSSIPKVVFDVDGSGTLNVTPISGQLGLNVTTTSNGSGINVTASGIGINISSGGNGPALVSSSYTDQSAQFISNSPSNTAPTVGIIRNGVGTADLLNTFAADATTVTSKITALGGAAFADKVAIGSTAIGTHQLDVTGTGDFTDHLTVASSSADAIRGTGTGGWGGVLGISDTVVGVFGVSTSGDGIRGQSVSANGVSGLSNSGPSGLFVSNSSANASATLISRQNGASTADLFQVQSSALAVLAKFDSSGNLTTPHLNLPTGAAGTVGTATLNGTTGVTVNTTEVTASSRIFVTYVSGAAIVNGGLVAAGSIVAGTSFKIYSVNVLDTNTVSWEIIN